LLLVLAALALAGTPLGIANSMFAGIALGIGLDFAIHLTTAYRQRLRQGMPASEALRSTLELTGPAVCVSAASITAGFSVLLLSKIAPERAARRHDLSLPFDLRGHHVATHPQPAQTLEPRMTRN
jgi:predicted RND superfamily exporter protein